MDNYLEQVDYEKELMMKLNSGLNDSQLSIQQNQDLLNELYKLQKNRIDKVETRMKTVESQTEENTNVLKKRNVLTAPEYDGERKVLDNVFKARVYKLLGECGSCTYGVFWPFLFKRIRYDAAKALNVPYWNSIRMDDYGEPNSTYNQELEYAQNWKPSNDYVKWCLNNLIDRRDHGYLKPERCRMLTDFLAMTDNGKNLPW